MSNEIGDLKIRVGVEVDTAGAKKQHDTVANDAMAKERAAAQKSKGFWAAAARAIGVRQKAETNESAEARTRREVQAAQESAAAWDNGFQRSGQILAGSIAAGAAGIALFARELYASGLAIDRQSRQLGVSAQEFQRYGYIAEQVGLEQNGLVASLAHLQQQAAADGDMRSASELFAEMADRIQALGPGTESTALAMQSFGEQGRALLPVLLQGRRGIERLGGEFASLGGGLDDETIASIAELDRTLNRAKQQLLALVMPIVRQAVPALREFAGKIGGVIDGFKKMLGESHLLRAGIITLGALIVGVGVAAAVAWAPIVATLGAILVGAAILGVVLDDLITTLEGGDSVVRRFVDSLWGIGATARSVQELKDAWDGLNVVLSTGTDIADAAADLGPLGEVIHFIAQGLKSVARDLPRILGQMAGLGPLMTVFGAASNLGSSLRAARAQASAPIPFVPPRAPAGYGVLAATPALSAAPAAVGAAGGRVVTIQSRPTINIGTLSGQLDAAARAQIETVVTTAMANASQAAIDDLATTGDE